jgi:hypothetical protein
MKLLSKSDNENLKQAELARDQARTESVREALSDAQSSLDETEAKFDLIMAKQQKYMAEEEQKHIVKIESLKKEVEKLEERQKVAHFPIAPAERKAYDNLEKSKQTLLSAQLQKEKNEEIEEKLTDKLDSLSDRDALLDRREDKVKAMEVSALDQKNHLKFMSESLAEKWEEFYKASFDSDKKLRERERLVELHQKDLDSREDALLMQQEDVRTDKEKIQSDRQTLQAAFEELNKHGKQHIKLRDKNISD